MCCMRYLKEGTVGMRLQCSTLRLGCLFWAPVARVHFRGQFRGQEGVLHGFAKP